jgi:hypothetical protein
MVDNDVRDDIAFIREAIGQGRRYACESGTGLIVWGAALAAGHVATYAFVRGWLPLAPAWTWTICIGLPWLYSLRRPRQRFFGSDPSLLMPLRMLWFGCGVFLTSLAVAAMWTGDIRFGWFDPVMAGAFGVAVFATAWLAGIAWLRWIAVAWWLGELALYAFRHHPEALLLATALLLLLMAGPGLVLAMQHRAGPAA